MGFIYTIIVNYTEWKFDIYSFKKVYVKQNKIHIFSSYFLLFFNEIIYVFKKIFFIIYIYFTAKNVNNLKCGAGDESAEWYIYTIRKVITTTAK